MPNYEDQRTLIKQKNELNKILKDCKASIHGLHYDKLYVTGLVDNIIYAEDLTDWSNPPQQLGSFGKRFDLMSGHCCEEVRSVMFSIEQRERLFNGCSFITLVREIKK